MPLLALLGTLLLVASAVCLLRPLRDCARLRLWFAMPLASSMATRPQTGIESDTDAFDKSQA
jgi:hypothetical protein